MNENAPKPRTDGLGRGIDSLMGDTSHAAPASHVSSVSPVSPVRVAVSAPETGRHRAVPLESVGIIAGATVAGAVLVTVCALLGAKVSLGLFRKSTKEKGSL